MDRKALESVAKHYPYLHLQGLFAIPAGLIWFLVGLSNLQRQPVKPLILGGGALVALGALGLLPSTTGTTSAVLRRPEAGR